MLLVHHRIISSRPILSAVQEVMASGRGQTKASHGGQRPFAHKFTGRDQRKSGFLAGCRNNG